MGVVQLRYMMIGELCIEGGVDDGWGLSGLMDWTGGGGRHGGRIKNNDTKLRSNIDGREGSWVGWVRGGPFFHAEAANSKTNVSERMLPSATLALMKAMSFWIPPNIVRSASQSIRFSPSSLVRVGRFGLGVQLRLYACRIRACALSSPTDSYSLLATVLFKEEKTR